MNSPPKRRWLRFSLHTMLVVVTVLCVSLAWKVRQAERQKEVVAWVEEMGGRVIYDYQHDVVDVVEAKYGFYYDDVLAAPPGPGWLAHLGVDYFATVVEVRFYHNEVSDLAPLEDLPYLEELVLPIQSISSLTPSLKNPTNVRSLFLRNVGHDWLPSNLTILPPCNTKITANAVAEEIAKLRKALPNCKIYRDVRVPF